MKVLVLGASGMAGHVIALTFIDEGHDVHTLTRTPFPFGKNVLGDVSDIEWLTTIIEREQYDLIVNAIGILIQAAQEEPSKAVFINSYLPHKLASITKDMSTRVFHMSTDCVFSGKKGGYLEDDVKDGPLFYDQSKALGELNNDKDLTFRMSIIGPELKASGVGLMHWFLTQESTVKGYRHAYWTGVTTLTLAHAMLAAYKENITGLYHLVHSQNIAKYDLLMLINQELRFSPLSIEGVNEPFIDKTLINTRRDFSFQVPDYATMIRQQHAWIQEHSSIYSHYKIK